MNISFRKISAIMQKQINHSYKNTTILVNALITPILAVMMVKLLAGVNQTFIPTFILATCSVMSISMLCVGVTGCMMAEEKEKNTLRVLMTSTVSSIDYLLGVGVTVWLMSMGVSVLLLLICGVYINVISYLIFTAIASIPAIVLGAIVGLLSKNQISASIVSLPAIFLVMLPPIFGSMSKSLHTVSQTLFSQQIYDYILRSETIGISWHNIIVVLLNTLVFFVAFIMIYRHRRLDA